ncbi:hypothetical protein BH20PSE1_BH20PSE1_01060 [soil metagenome]
MDKTALDGLLAELAHDRPAALAVTEGLRDDLRLNLKPQTRVEVDTLLSAYERREGLLVRLEADLTQAKTTIVALIADGHPALPRLTIGSAELEDLRENRRTIEAAEGQFDERLLTTEGTVIVGPEVAIS